MLETQSVSPTETKTVAVDTVMPPGYSLVPTVVRTNRERIRAIKANLNLLNQHIRSIDESFSNLEKRIACFALLAHCARALRAMDDLVKKEVKEDKQTAIVIALEHSRKKVERFRMHLTRELEGTTVDRPQPSDEDGPTAVIAGFGPTGAATAVAFLKHKEFKGRVVVISDKYAEFPTRSGNLGLFAMSMYLDTLGISYSSYEKLKIFFTVRNHVQPSIKHLDIAGRAIYLAYGGKIVQGRVNSYDQMSLSKDEKHLDLTLNTEEDTIGKTIFNLSCMIMTTGYKAFYPDGMKREQLSSAPCRKRIKHTQVNVLISSALLLDKLRRLMNRVSLVGFYSNTTRTQSIFFTKVQLFLFLTTEENSVLEAVVSQYHLSAEQKALLKLKLYVDYLNKGPLDWSGLMLRDQIKSGKRLCSEYEGAQLTAPDQKIVALSAPKTSTEDDGEADFKSTTKTVTTWAGASAMPSILVNGLFAQQAAIQGIEVANQLVETNFAPGRHGAPIKAHFDKVTQEMIEKIEQENNKYPDQSKQLKRFLRPLMPRVETPLCQDSCRLL